MNLKKGVSIFVSFVVMSTFLLISPEASKADTMQRIGFTAYRTGRPQNFIMNEDGSNPINISNSPNTDDFMPVWSPNGKKIAFHVGDQGDSQIFVMNSDYSGRTNITNRSGTYNCCASWSPDGKKITFSTTRDGNFEIYSMDLDGTNQTNLTNNPAIDRLSAWSPMGDKIVFYSERDGNKQIYLMNSDGSNQINLSNNTESELSPTWSPDGQKIAFTSQVSDWDESSSEIYIMNNDGTYRIRVTYNNVLDAQPQWSPDGSKFACYRGYWGNYEIFTMNIDGTNEAKLTFNNSDDFQPNWVIEPHYYSFEGFFSPVDNPPVVNRVKAGSAIPVKFSLGGDQGMDIFSTGYPVSQTVSCDTTLPMDDIEETVMSGASSLSYDPGNQKYQYVWKTKSTWANTCRQLVLKFDDGSVHTATFKFK
jgi:dipeptidyl aminopeptidase/acylaminoacyl peptidase